MAGWLKKAEDTTMAAPGGPGGVPPMTPPMKAPTTEKEDVATAESVIKALKALIAREKSEGGSENKKDAKGLEDALKKVEDFAEAEKKQKEDKKKEDDKAAEKAKKDEPKGE